MSLSKDGIMIILSSPSGAGKTTLVKKISKEKNFKISVSHTTRQPRPNEINGVDYFFITENEFQKLINEGEFLEYANVFKNLYGSTKKEVFKNLKNGHNVLFDIDWQGAEQIKNQSLSYNVISFFILPPSKEILHQRLISRGENNDDILQMRMKQFDKDVLHWVDYDFVVVNEDLDKCYNEIIGYLDNSKDYKKSEIEKYIQKLI